MTRPTLATLVADGALDADTAALLWLLGEGGLPCVVAGGAPAATRTEVAEAVVSAVPGRAWVVLDAEASALGADHVTAYLRGGVGLAVTLGAADLRAVSSRLQAPPKGLPEDAVRRLGVVLIVESTAKGPRVVVAHYLRPTERDAEGHVQRRPPAVLASWVESSDAFDDYAWGVTPELADRVDRSQADLEERRRDRAAFLRRLLAEGVARAADWEAEASAYLATEPARVPAPERERARPSPIRGGLTDPHVH